MNNGESQAKMPPQPQKNKQQAKWKVLIMGVLLIFMVSGYWVLPGLRPGAKAPPKSQVPEESRLDTPSRTEKITLVAVGDILMHNTQIWSGQQEDGSYAFDFFSPVKELISEGDYASTDLEAPLGGSEGGYTGYPLFNSPDAIADTIKNAGFDLVFTANNHMLDRGAKGALRTLNVLQGRRLDTAGSFKNRDRLMLIKEIRGVKVGYLAYTYGTNGIPLPQDKPYLVNLLNKEKVLADIQKIRSEADVVVLALHWGVEYNPKPTEEQKELAQEFLKAGADVILGSHPHVIEPMEVIKDGDKYKFVIYSMGNFIGDQHELERNSGVILKLQFEKNFESGRTELSDISYTPTFSQSYLDHGRRKFRVVAVEDAMANVRAGKEPYLKMKDLPMLEQVLKQTQAKLGKEGDPRILGSNP